MSVDSARVTSVVRFLVRAGARLSLAGLILAGAAGELQNAIAEGDTRTLSFHHVHTGEDITITFKRNGRYDKTALKKLDWFMRDWRKQQETRMDPHLFDLLWEVYREVDATQPIQIICGYRSPATNSMLRARSSGVARRSQHIEGHAIDFFIPGVPLAKVRAVGLRLQRGGVGFYPTSGSPFVHMDTGSIRHWPRIARAELMKIFPDGRTVHVPSDGKPLRNYALALADVERQGHRPNGVSLNAAREAGAITAREERAAEQPSLLAALFGRGKHQDNDEDDDAASANSASKGSRAPTVVASLSARQAESTPPVPLPMARPKLTTVAAVTPNPTSAPAANVLSERGYWRGAVAMGPSLAPAKPTAPIAPFAPFDVASAGDTPVATGSTAPAMSYAAEADGVPKAKVAHAKPMGKRLPHLISTAMAHPADANTTVVTKSPLLTAPMAIGGQRWGSPWLRASMLTPSVAYSMRATRLGATDPRWLHSLLHKPSQSLVMTFSDDPNLGMVADRFSGDAVVFLATATFTKSQTASLR